ncbi:hypothetical protein MRX96_018929 [Rhipicephalus microplus]
MDQFTHFRTLYTAPPRDRVPFEALPGERSLRAVGRALFFKVTGWDAIAAASKSERLGAVRATLGQCIYACGSGAEEAEFARRTLSRVLIDVSSRTFKADGAQ